MERYVVEKNTLKELVTSHLKLRALECGGVDNWSWYCDSLNNFLKDYIKYNNIEVEEIWDYSFEDMAEDFILHLTDGENKLY